MRLRLPKPAAHAGAAARRRLPFGLPPAWLAAVGHDGTLATWRIRVRWDGRVVLQPGAIPAGEPCVAVLHPDLPYRRKLQRYPAAARARQALLKAAPDEFPLPAESVRYALGRRGGDGYLYALPEAEIDKLRQSGLQPAVVLVSGGEPDEAGCLEALEAHEARGDGIPLLAGRRLLPRRLPRFAVPAALLLVLLGGAGQLLLGPDLLGNALGWRLQALRSEAGELQRLHNVTEAMLASREAAARLFALPEANAPAMLGKLLATVPPGHSVRRIEIAGGMLRVAGSGAEVEAWLTGAGFPPGGIVIEKTGSFHAWRAERPL